MGSLDSAQAERGGISACAVLAVFSLHNAWNCFAFLNFANYPPTEALLGVQSSAVGLLTTCGWLGIVATLPLVPLMPHSRQRALLFAGGALNVAAPVLRCFAAARRSYALVLLSNVMLGNAFGLLGAWPPMLASQQWPERRHALVMAVASLSNYVGGAVGVVVMPVAAPTAEALLSLFRAQAYLSAALGLLTAAWLWIPPFGGDGARGGGGASLCEELRHCLRGRAPLHLLLFGGLVGVSLGLQGANQYILAGVGFTDTESGVGNAVYQLAAASVGVGLGAMVQSARRLQAVLCGLHALMVVAVAAMAVLCAEVRRRGRFDGALPLMLLCLSLLGLSLMGMLPFCLQQAVHSARPASTNVVAGLFNLVAMSLDAGLNQLCASVEPLAAVASAEKDLQAQLDRLKAMKTGVQETIKSMPREWWKFQRPDGVIFW